MSSFTPTTAELALVSQVFAAADTQKLGIITGDAAVKIFAGAKLSPTVLGEVWAIADKENNGFLTRKGVAIALRLIGHAQNGQPVRESFLDKPAPLAHLEGISKAPSTTPSFSSSPVPKSPPPAGTSAFPPLTPQDKTKFARIFAGSGPVNGVLGGDKAKDIFIKSKLPVDKLSQIWNMADTQNRGALDQTDFTIAMYLIQACMSNKIPVLPTSLPPGLYEQAAGGQTPGLVSHGTGTSGSFSPVASIFPTSTGTPVQAQYTGQSVLRPRMTGQAYQGSPSHPSAGPVNKPSPFSVAPQPWDISPEEKANADRFFEGIDTERKGYIEGDVAVPFMLQSNLPEDTLAQIWDLADLNNDGRLTRDGFAVAMHLIQGKLAGKEIPVTLPVSLVPPSMRAQKSGWSMPFSAPSAPPPMSEPMRDLLGDDTPLPTASAPSTIGASPFPPQATGATRSVPVVPQSHGAFAPQTSLPTPAPSGFSSFPPQVHKDLLGDDDEPAVASPPLPDNSAEIGNVQNQLNSTNRSLETTKSERHLVEQNLANQAGELSALQTQLFSAKAAYETETKLLSNLRERFSTQAAEIQKTKEELIRAESDLSAVRVEKSEIEGGFLRDKEEVRDLHRKMKEVGDEVEQLKAAIEKAKRDAKQQKGLLAIARKQLSTREAEKAKVAKELADASADAEQATNEREEAEAELAKEPGANHLNGTAIQPPPLARLDTPAFAANQPLPVSPNITGPLSTTSTGTKSTNPFERLALSSGSPSSRSASPFQSFAAESPVHPSSVAPSTDINEVDDPFGLSDAVEDAQPTPVADKPPKPSPISVGQLASPVSPDEDDLFRTPLGTSVVPSAAITPHEVKSTTDTDAIDGTSTSVEDAAAHFPPLDIQFPGSFPTEGHKAASDLSGPLKEIEHDSDTDSDDEAAFQDARVSVKDNEPSSPLAAHADHEAVGLNGNAVAPSSTPFGAFDDAFGVSAPNPTAAIAGPGSRSQSPANIPAHRSPTPNKAAEEDLFSASNGVKPATPFDPPSANLPDAGLSAFDEAMGKVPSSASGDTPNFKFDSAFDDNFDFAAAGAGTTAFPPPPSKQTSSVPVSSPPFPVNGTKAASSPKADDGGFDSIFGAQDKVVSQPSVPTSSFLATSAAENKTLSFDDAFASTGPSVPSEAKTTDSGISFDDAFGGGDSLSKTLAFDSAFKPATAPTVGAASSPSATAPSSPAVTFENASGPASPTSPSVGKRSTSPAPRHHSPPPRTSSPRPRPSTGSSKDSSHEKPVSTARHSKLSIRLPFGKKDKKKAKNEPILPQASTYLSPVSEPSRVMTPAVEDDVEPVKQLCGMGFSRTQAVNALETHGYDVQKALNSLLGQA
ncbi:hypothetical protein BD410DRAFT_739994 [Rickenella mellea]|uniref:Uncharacterized protein n=1 Tax=Rickenella mellea TaxID=50990 RepID=A0A4Y7QHT7_9AGAM|nr:hypothetical protein BD410DRAFT_739994 [Rickenella mellea]